MLSRRTLITTLLAAALSSPAFAAEPLKVGFVYVGPIGDAGWTHAHDLGRKAMEKALPGQIKSTFVESVPEGADAERVIRQLAAAGNTLIFTTSFGYMNQTQKVAQAFPNVKFAHATGYKTAKNVAIYNPKTYEGAYMLGVIAGGMTKSNTLGFVGSFPIPEVIRNINAYTLGAQSVNPKIKTKVVWVNSWYDPAKERQAAETLIAQGADVLAQNTDSPAVVQTAQEKGKYAMGWDTDMAKFGPKAQLTASTINWGGYYTRAAKATLDKSWKSDSVDWGIKDGMVALSPLNPVVPKALAAKFDAKKALFASGKFHSFTGPIVDQAGKTMVAAGQVLPQKGVDTMNWYVKGVEGSIPK
ncbi:BMP family ABC transporter substrate-binding protein [Craterilacuibacter sp. RT1T]|uniref:BMP family ABC transporter substrate-binding protein n=1 Tax=Craterilacuibacter sp. RT1T TaxID=2942211 RepID=UPI0020BF8DE7|nr:BMP family ABC transporter substrate-binding protein [Craterilacuibacter sp. RT1T]MCL6263933.1 BMP family ABC transporter substrate-binding protein [Craterilacuibacter sp. RT1T]